MQFSSKEDHLDQIQSLVRLYNEVKEIIVLAEYSGKQGYLMSCTNELKATLDHIMKTFLSESDQILEIERAKGHLYRAGFDAYEIIATEKLSTLKKVTNTYGYEAVTTGFPEYHTKISPLIGKSIKRLAIARSTRVITNTKDELSNFSEIESIVTELLQAEEELDSYLYGIQEAKKHLRFNSIRNYALALMTGVLLAWIGLKLEYKFFANDDNKTHNTEKKAEIGPRK